ncbi:MAG: OmpA family protein [Myxococcaceae bacterium]|nr:OmpA family protein [Myxococcaceae bacterium]
MNLKSLGAVLVMAWMASSCGEELRTSEAEPTPAEARTTTQWARSTNKVLILDSSVSGGPNSREAQAVKAHDPATHIDVVSPAQWRAITAEQFMLYRAIILGDATCASGSDAFQAAVDTRDRWGAIVDGTVAIVSTDPAHNDTPQLVENAIRFVLGPSPHRTTGMYISLGCAYQAAPANTPVPLLEPFGDFKVQGVTGCATSGHLFQLSPATLSDNLSDGQLPGDGCAARSVFTHYPEHTFAFAAIATSSSGAPLPGQQPYVDYFVAPDLETSFVGTPYVVARGAVALSAGCGLPDHSPSIEQCDLGDGLNGRLANPGENPAQTCSFSCHLNWCGDGFVDTALGEECDDGINNGRTRDSSGNIGACSSFCKIPDITPPNRPPVARCKSVTVAATSTCGVPADINDGSNDPDGDLVGCTQSPSGAYPIGSTTVTLTCTDQAGQSASCAGTVTVRDEVLPTVTLQGPASEALECLRGARYSDPGATAQDACEGPLSVTTSGSVNLEVPGSYQVSYTATDSAGAVETASRAVVVADTQPPHIVCPEPIVVETLEGALISVTPGVATATDTCSQARVSSAAQTRFPVGTTPVQYTATDEAGNTATCTSTITVLRVKPPDSTGVPSPDSLDRALMGGGSSCSATGSGPSSLALMGLGLLASLLLRKRARPGLVVLAGVLVAATASAQLQGVPTFDLELLKLNPSGKGSLLLGTGELLPDGDYRLSLTTHYEKDPLVLLQNGRQVGVVVRHRTTAHLAAAYGLWGRLELGAQVPLVLFQRGDDLTARGVGGLEGGVAPGTPLFHVQMKLLSQREDDLVDLALGLQAGPPVGSAAALARELRATPNLMVGRTFDSLRAAIDAGVLLRPRTVLTPDENIQDELGHALRLGGALSSLGQGLRGELALSTLVPLKRQGFSVEALTGARWPVSETVEAYGLAGLGFGTAPGTPDFRVLFGMAYGRTQPARVELASYDPGPTPRDSDGDGILDEMDRCPTMPGLPGFQGCPDQDDDSVEDEVDLCPSEPGLVELRGCPVEDSDGDGVVDESDDCPTEAGLAERRGCPFLDKDEDTVEDVRDNCPDEAGPADNQGCPAEEEQLVTIETDRIAIKDTVHFDFDKATIQPRSFALLDQVARVLREHPEILSVSIEGHTDDQGPAEYNRNLSQRRSESVREYLSRKGVAPERMEARGFGEDRPVESNRTNAGRAANRRVEFITRYADSQK